MNAKYDTRLTAMTRLIYTDLQLRCGYGRRTTKVSDNELSQLFGITARSASRSINTLCKRGYISKVKLLDSRIISILSDANNY